MSNINLSCGTRGLWLSDETYYTSKSKCPFCLLKVHCSSCCCCSAESQSPTAAELERFLTSTVNRLTPVSGEVLSVQTLRVGLSSLLKASAFYFPSFSLRSTIGSASAH